ncbi:MAG: aldose 1-epimerase family protein [Clostridium sp.]|nr:aldose 1-epimerase family protein [Clostridium sp.]
MVHVLENDNLKISINTYGGELNSIFNKKNDTEYLWDGNTSGWKYHAPVLFPIVGKVKDFKYKVNNAIYELPQHGLARVSDFNMVEKTNDTIRFDLEYSKDTLKVYPFKFRLSSIYTLTGSTVKVQYKVFNMDDKSIYFSIGSHPAFRCPIDSEESIEDCYLEFENEENASINVLTKDGYLYRDKESYMVNTNIINLKKGTFKNDALIFSSLNSNKVSIKSVNNDKSVTVDFKDFPYLGIWSPLNGARLLCIEPWYGHADYCDFEGEFSTKEGVIELAQGKEFECSYSVEIN